jgi:hypothetical protein
MALAKGIQLGSYEIIAPLGAGAMGRVFIHYETNQQPNE